MDKTGALRLYAALCSGLCMGKKVYLCAQRDLPRSIGNDAIMQNAEPNVTSVKVEPYALRMKIKPFVWESFATSVTKWSSAQIKI